MTGEMTLNNELLLKLSMPNVSFVVRGLDKKWQTTEHIARMHLASYNSYRSIYWNMFNENADAQLHSVPLYFFEDVHHLLRSSHRLQCRYGASSFVVVVH